MICASMSNCVLSIFDQCLNSISSVPLGLAIYSIQSFVKDPQMTILEKLSILSIFKGLFCTFMNLMQSSQLIMGGLFMIKDQSSANSLLYGSEKENYIKKCQVACRAWVEEFEDIDKLPATENGLSLLQLIEVFHLTFFLQYAASSTGSYFDVSHVSFAQYICNYSPI